MVTSTSVSAVEWLLVIQTGWQGCCSNFWDYDPTAILQKKKKKKIIR